MRMIWTGMAVIDPSESSPGNLMGTKNPHEIRFTQESIRGTFRDGRTIDQLATALRTGMVNPETIPPIRVFFRDDLLYSLDNRRLEAFRRACIDIPVKLASFDEIEAETWKFTTTNEGATIRVR